MSNTSPTSQMELYLGNEGLRLTIPFMKRITNGCFPTWSCAVMPRNIERALRAVLMALYFRPASNKEFKNSNTCVISGSRALILGLSANNSHLCI